MKNCILYITWVKAFGEIYCHHASLFIPCTSPTLFPPDVIRVGITTRTNNIEKQKIKSFYDRTESCYLPCKLVGCGYMVPLDSASLIDKICLDSWTTLKNKVRGIHKEFPTSLFYQIQDEDQRVFNFDYKNLNTPALISESKFALMKDDDKINVEINLE